MASFGSKKEFSKRDMNFFAEFTAAAARTTRMIGYIAVLMVVAVVAIILALVYCIIRNVVISQEVKELDATLASDEYKNVRSEAEQLNDMYVKRNNYLYSLSQMKKQVITTPDVKRSIEEQIVKCIPSDTRVTSYNLSGSSLTITGESFLYRSINDFVHELNKTDVFTTECDLKVNRVSPEQFGDMNSWLKTDASVVYSDVVYEFEVTGTLVNDVYVSVSRFVKDEKTKNVSCLKVEDPQKKKVRDKYEVPELLNIEVNGVKYELSGITLNGRDIKKDDFERIKNSGKYEIVMTANTDIGLYYSEVKEKAADKKDADNKESEATK